MTKSTWGGPRPGAGRKKTVLPALPASPKNQTPLEFLLMAMHDESADPRTRIEAAKAAAPYLHSKKGEPGSKSAANDAAKIAAQGKFAPCAPPKPASIKRVPPH